MKVGSSWLGALGAVVLCLGAGCALTQGDDPAAEAASESGLSDGQVARYSFTEVATLPSWHAVVGAARGGAIVVAEIEGPSGTTDTTTLRWDGAKLTPLPAAVPQPTAASGSFFYDTKSGVTHYLEVKTYSTSSGSERAEKLMTFDGSAWQWPAYDQSSRYPARAPATPVPRSAVVYVDGIDGKIYRETDDELDVFVSKGAYDAHWEKRSNGGYGENSAAAYDTSRNRLVVAYPRLVEELSPPTRPYAAPAWDPTPTGLALDGALFCTQAVFDTRAKRTIAFCKLRGGSAGITAIEWDGTTARAAETEVAGVPRLYGFDSIAYDRTNGKLLAVVGDKLYVAKRVMRTKAPPTLLNTSASAFATVEKRFTLQFDASTTEKTTATFLDLPAGARWNDSDRTLTWTPSVADEGKREIHVELSRGGVTKVSTFTVEVEMRRYADLPADVALEKDLWITGSSRHGGIVEDIESHWICRLTGKNPGAVTTSCYADTSLCGPLRTDDDRKCSDRLSLVGILGEDGNVSARDERTSRDGCDPPVPGGSCPTYTKVTALSIDASAKVCVSFDYDYSLFPYNSVDASGRGCER